jgi:resuscitation-promoting factor RpfA
MNIEDDGLTPEERALEREFAQRLARLGPQREPSPALDARVLAAAHAAVQPRAKRRRPATWPTVFGLAASVVFALGLAWKLRPEPGNIASSPSPASAEEPLADYAAPPPPAEVYTPRPQRVLEVPAPPPAEAPARTRGSGASKPRPAPSQAPAQEPPFAFEAAPAPVEAPPPPPPAPVAQQGVLATPAAANSSTAAQAAADAATMRREAADASAARATQDNVRAFEMRKATAPATATVPENDVEFAEPDEEVVPPATADSPQVRDAWLQRIRELAKSGRLDDARASLREFRHRYPGVALPQDLRALGE